MTSCFIFAMSSDCFVLCCRSGYGSVNRFCNIATNAIHSKVILSDGLGSTMKHFCPDESSVFQNDNTSSGH